jgi:hypothetical protein
MFMQEIMCLIDKFASTSEIVLQENQGALFVYELISKCGKDQDAKMKYSRWLRQKTRNSCDKTPFLDRGDNDV